MPILIVDDDLGLSSLMQTILQRAGMAAEIASTGREAIQRLSDRPTRLLLLDLGLPDMNGQDVIERLQADGNSVPFIVVTGRGDQQVAVDLMKRGARDYLVKDASLLDLLPSVVSQALQQLERDRRLAEAELRIREQNEFLQSILNSLTHPLYVIDTRSRTVQMANNAAMATHRMMPGTSCGQLHHPDSLDCAANEGCPIEAVGRSRAPVVSEHVEYTDGQARIFEIHGYPVFNQQGEVTQVIEYNLDVTVRRRAEQALRESEARLRQVVESLPMVLASWDMPGNRFMLMIGAVENMFGFSRQHFLEDAELLGRIIVAEDAERLAGTLEQGITANRPFEVDFRVRHGHDGRIVWIQTHAAPVRDEEGAVIRVDAVLVDVTEEKRIAGEREQLEAHLQQAQKLESLGVLAGGIAHDFNNLLTVISGNAQFLRESLQLGPAESKALSDIEAAARNATDMTRSMQAFSRPSKPQIVHIDANALAEEVYRFLRRLIPVRIEFHLKLFPRPCCFAADPAQMQQVLVNLCVNARDAMTGEGVLEMEISRVPADQLPAGVRHEAEACDYVCIRVSDTGCGMDREIIARVFDPFFTTKTKDQGTGLGLAIVYRIVQAHNGLIDLQSTPGAGTAFAVYFPQLQVDDVPEPPAPRAVVRGNERILVIDDEAMIASLLKTMLESSGFSVAVAHSPDEALNLARQAREPFQLAVVDYSLPGMSGDVCLQRLRELCPSMRGVLITGYEVGNLELDLSGLKIIQKPFSAQGITQVVREMLDN